jgi:hypothetical protein
VDPVPRGLRIASPGAPAAAPASKRAQTFRRLLDKVSRLQRAVQAWTHAEPAIHRGTTDYQQRAADHAHLLADLVRLLDRHHAAPELTTHERGLLRDIVCQLAGDFAADHPDLKAIYNRHSQRDFDADAAEIEACQARAARAALERDLDLDFGDATFDSLDDLRRAAHDQLDERERADAAERADARRKKSPRQLASEARRATETAQLGKTLQDVYRKLARLLHPDHERDPDERARKTALMQEVNAAYARRDLLALLELRLRFEHIDPAAVHTVADDRLAHFNRLLTEQSRQLQHELAALEAPWRHQLDLGPRAKLAPPLVLPHLAADLARLTAATTQLRHDLARLADPAELRAWLRAAERVTHRPR